MSKVSIVVPIYNVEQYLEKCIKSIVDQTYSNLEIILVDDGSKDSSSEICNKWKEEDQRIVVIHKENGGLSSARNAGLEVATGDYIMFEDSDDWLELDIVEKCVERIEKDASDLVIFGYTKVDEKSKNLGSFTFGNDTYTREEMAGQLHSRILEMSFGYAWNKLYRLSVIRESGVVNDGSIIDREDLYFNLQLFSTLNRISFLNKEGYYYLQRKTSLLHNADLARLDNVDIFCNKMREIHWGDEQSETKVYNMVILHYLADCFIKNIIRNKSMRRKESIKYMQDIIDNNKICIYKDSDNPNYLNCLAHSITKHKMRYFYYYVKIADFKTRVGL